MNAKFNLILQGSEGPSFSSPFDLIRALDLMGSDEEVDALADLQVGQTYVDSDGDTWERVE